MSLTLQQVAQHNNEKSCWVIIENKVYDVTEFLSEHPGGAKIILKYAGRDATSAYKPIHPSDALDKNLPADKHLGSLDASSSTKLQEQQRNVPKTKDQLRVEKARKELPPLSHMISIKDLTQTAIKVMSYKAHAYYSSAADDEIAADENARAFSRFFFNARVMRPVSTADISTTILGFKSSIPVFVSGAALAKLGHPNGEANITVGAHHTGIIQMVSSNASLSYAEIAAARPSPDQVLFFQLYKQKDDAAALDRVHTAEELGYKAIFLTVDALVAGSRERDIKAPWVEEELERAGTEEGKKEHTAGETPKTFDDLSKIEDDTDNTNGTAGALIANTDMDMTWERTVPWLRSVTKLPIVIKGIQCVEDAVLAAEAGVDGILISNHGGRQLDYSMPSLEVLYKLRKQRPDVFDKVEVYMDGGVRRGTDVLKALCLGATAVGMGRPFLYAQSAYGSSGVVKLVRILEREIKTAMQLIGAKNVKELVPEMIERVDWQPLPSKL